MIDENGQEHSKAKVAPPNPTGKKWKIEVVLYSDSPPAEQTLAGMNDGWKRSGLVEGRDYEIKTRNAQGDMAALSGVLDAVLTDRADIIVPLSTPTLQAALHKIRGTPVVFSMVANPVTAGAGKSYTDHLPDFTGVSVLAPVGPALDMIQKYFPAYRRLGTLYCPAESNSVDLKESLEALCKQRGLILETVAVNSTTELSDAALSLVTRPIDAIVQISDNISSSGFSAITRAARQQQKPLISLNSTTVPLGAALAMGRDYHNSGEVTVELIQRVIRGESPAAIPFTLPPKLFDPASPSNARALGMTIPAELLKEVDKIIE